MARGDEARALVNGQSVGGFHLDPRLIMIARTFAVVEWCTRTGHQPSTTFGYRNVIVRAPQADAR
jgi:hypothetical protein